MSPPPKNIQVNIRMDPELKAAAEAAAAADRRTLTSWIEKMIIDQIARQATLSEWTTSTRIRFLRALFEAGHGRVLQPGAMAMAYTIKYPGEFGIEPARLVLELQDINFKMAQLIRNPHFLHIYTNRRELRPYFRGDETLPKVDEILECCITPDEAGTIECWRVSRFGQVAEVRPFREDADSLNKHLGREPGTWFSPRFMTSRLVDLVMHAAVFSHKFPGAERIEFRCEWSGLAERELAELNMEHAWDKGQIARASERVSTGEWSVVDVRHSPYAIVRALGGPVLRMFNPVFDYLPDRLTGDN